ncbi:hypothetical protein GHT07_20650 [Caenimonas koreensis DSM 17982]|uniref:Uncharacterized protein n=1 Tax=Caenimonas koreensis DSM 17982 TaxID=1121255 RepID=A0A844BE23_9BURK|nr:hypothetical protein [Caenimonas koreensis]MRD49687.1 hypothetical protein [Caenimonas koreensis DSM 17982]
MDHPTSTRRAQRQQRRCSANPLLALPAVQRVRMLPLPVRLALGELLTELELDCAHRAQHSWAKHKAPVAAYFVAVATFTRHLRQRAVLPDHPACLRRATGDPPTAKKPVDPGTDRSAREDVRNPVLALPAVARLRDLPAPARATLAEALRAFQAECARLAQRDWAERRCASAALHKAAAVYAGHIRRAMIRPAARENVTGWKATPTPTVAAPSRRLLLPRVFA